MIISLFPKPEIDEFDSLDRDYNANSSSDSRGMDSENETESATKM